MSSWLQLDLDDITTSIRVKMLLAGAMSLGREDTLSCYLEIKEHGETWLNANEYRVATIWLRHLAEHRGVL